MKIGAVQEDAKLLNDLKRPEDTDNKVSKFRDFCETNEINVFRVVSAVYRIVSFEPNFVIKATNLNCFLFEQIHINSMTD
jgi:hypothetical protein